MSSSDSWKRAFAKQAVTDFEARDCLLRFKDLPACHQLHYLQMAFEKVAKAYLIGAGSDPESLQQSHAYIAKNVPIIVRDSLTKTPGAKSPWVIEAVRDLARRIELLAPAVDAGGRVPANCEYPWEAPNGSIVAPAEHNFSLNLLGERAANTMIKIMWERAIELSL